MPCYYPLDGWRAKQPNESGKYPVAFRRNEAQQDSPLKLPCGSCIGCRLEYSRQWATRCVHESKMHEDNCFITLTYEDEFLPHNGNLVKSDFQTFMKRLRKQIEPKKIRYFAAGEYGSPEPFTMRSVGRPHFHAILFNHDFADREPVAKDLDSSETLTDLWGKGFASVGDMTFDSAAYVARYCVKKITGDEADHHYQTFDQETGQVVYLEPEFSLMSRRPGIGKPWFDKYRNDMDKGYITMRGHKMRPPKAYERWYLRDHEEDYEPYKERKRQSVDELDPDNTLNRLRVKEELTIHKLERKARSL